MIHLFLDLIWAWCAKCGDRQYFEKRGSKLICQACGWVKVTVK